MTEKEARQVIERMLAIWPAVKSYWAESSIDRKVSYESWLRALCKREKSDLDAVLDDWDCIACDKNFICNPVQTLIQLADANHRRTRPRPQHEPPNRQPRATNMLESYLAGIAATEAGRDLNEVLEGVL